MKTNARGSGMKTFLAVIFSVMLTFTMMPAMPFMTRDAHADTSLTNLETNTFDVRDGNVTIADGTDANHVKVTYGSSQTTKDNIATLQAITLTSNGNDATTNTVSVTTKNDVTIILQDLNINVSKINTGTEQVPVYGTCAFSKTGAGELKLKLKGSNFLQSGSNRAGLEKNGNNTGSLIIEDGDTAPNVGKLLATSGISYNVGKIYDGNGAGIGGGDNSSGNGYSGESITINSGNVTAKSNNGAGIGGGSGRITGGAGNNITISGGSVTAISSGFGAGIGGGIGGSAGGDSGIVTISGGSVTAESGDGVGVGGNGAGIGGGATAFEGPDPGGDGGTVTISGGSVTATSRKGAGIGGGANFNNDKGGAGGEVTISGGSVAATSTKGTGIGSGSGASNNGTLSSGTNGKAWVVRSGKATANEAAIDTSGSEFNSGILFNGTTGKVYGNTSLPGDETIPSGSTLTIDSGRTLTVPQGKTLTNNGTITSTGNIINEGTITNNGTLSSKSIIEGSGTYNGNIKFVLGNGSNVTLYPDGGNLVFNGMEINGDQLTLAAPTKSGYTCSGWKDNSGKSYGPTDTFAPSNDTTLTAQWASPTPALLLTLSRLPATAGRDLLLRDTLKERERLFRLTGRRTDTPSRDGTIMPILREMPLLL